MSLYYLHVKDPGFAPGWRRIGPYEKNDAETQAAHDRTLGIDVELVTAKDSDARLAEHTSEAA